MSNGLLFSIRPQRNWGLYPDGLTDGTIQQSGSNSSNNSDIVPVTIGSGGSFSKGVGSVSYTRVVFNDSEIQNSADRVVIMQEDKIMASEPVNGQKGIIIPGLLKLGSNVETNVLVLDKEGKELYNHRKFRLPNTRPNNISVRGWRR
jgi:hypothetical protein